MEYMAEAFPITEQHSVDIQRQPTYYLGPGGRQFKSARPDQIQLSYGVAVLVLTQKWSVDSNADSNQIADVGIGVE